MLFKQTIFLLLAFKCTAIEAQMGKPIGIRTRPKYRFKQVVVKGKPALQNEIPYMVSIKMRTYTTNDSEIYLWESFCGGSIIGPSRVLTAAHCFEGRVFQRMRKQNMIMAVAGELRNVAGHSVEPSTGGASQWTEIINVVAHKKFKFPYYDIALVFVEPSFYLGYRVYSVDIARRTMDYPTSCRTAGFGFVHRRGFQSPVLLVGTIVPMARSECRRLWGEEMRRFVCTASAISDVAEGDSGGPLACRRTLDRAERPGQDLLVGVVSGRNSDGTTLFTRVSTYADWIDRNFSSNLKLASCVLIVMLLLIL